MTTLFEAAMDWEQGDVRNGDIYRHWLACNARGRVSHRFQRLSRGNPCGIDASQVEADYKHAGRWGESWNNTATMPMPAVRVDGRKLRQISLNEALAAIANRGK